MLHGPSHSAMLPEVTRASWFSDRMCVSNILLTLSRLGSEHILKIFVNLNGSKYLNRHERSTTKPVEEPKSSSKISQMSVST